MSGATSPQILASVTRIVVGVVAGVGLLLLALGAAVRQPNWGKRAFPAGPRADARALRRHVEFLATTDFPRNPRHAEALERAARYVADGFSRSGGRVAEQPYAAGSTPTKNIIARFGPQEGRRLVIGAHYDVFEDLPGADDNASGVAGLLELARLLGSRSLASPVELVAFSSEEPPFFGSRDMGSAVHARSLRDAGADVRAMICLEMIGYFSPRQPNRAMLLSLIYPRTGDFVALAGRWSDRRLVRYMKSCFRGGSAVRAVSYSGPATIGIDQSDHFNYWAAGHPAVLVTDTAYFRNPNYHTARDVPASLDYERMAGVVDGVLSTAVHLSAEP